MIDWTKEFKKFLEENGIDVDAFLKRSTEFYMGEADDPQIEKPVTERTTDPAEMVRNAIVFYETETTAPYKHTEEDCNGHTRHRFWWALSVKWGRHADDIMERTTEQ